jgi:hypothetical protein
MATNIKKKPPPFNQQYLSIISDQPNSIITSIQRPKSSQIYRITGLGTKYHYSDTLPMIKQISKEHHNINRIIIPNSKSFKTTDTHVINDCSSKTPHHLRQMLDRNTNIFKEILPSLITKFSFDNKRNIASYSCGWTRTNSHEYKRNRYTILGNVKPFLFNNSELDYSTKRKLCYLMHDIIKNMAKDNIIPNQDQLDKDPALKICWSYRKRARMSLAKHLGIDKEEELECIGFNFPEAFTIICNEFILIHYDKLNPKSDDLDESYAVNIVVPVTNLMLQSKGLGKLLKQMNKVVGDDISFSIIMYNRKCISDYCTTLYNIQQLKEKSDNPFVPNLLHLITEKVHSKLDFNRLWDCERYWELPEFIFTNEDTEKDIRQCIENYCVVTASLDKMVCVLVLLVFFV